MTVLPHNYPVAQPERVSVTLDVDVWLNPDGEILDARPAFTDGWLAQNIVGTTSARAAAALRRYFGEDHPRNVLCEALSRLPMGVKRYVAIVGPLGSGGGYIAAGAGPGAVANGVGDTPADALHDAMSVVVNSTEGALQS